MCMPGSESRGPGKIFVQDLGARRLFCSRSGDDRQRFIRANSSNRCGSWTHHTQRRSRRVRRRRDDRGPRVGCRSTRFGSGRARCIGREMANRGGGRGGSVATRRWGRLGVGNALESGFDGPLFRTQLGLKRDRGVARRRLRRGSLDVPERSNEVARLSCGVGCGDGHPAPHSHSVQIACERDVEKWQCSPELARFCQTFRNAEGDEWSRAELGVQLGKLAHPRARAHRPIECLGNQKASELCLLFSERLVDAAERCHREPRVLPRCGSADSIFQVAREDLGLGSTGGERRSAFRGSQGVGAITRCVVGASRFEKESNVTAGIGPSIHRQLLERGCESAGVPALALDIDAKLAELLRWGPGLHPLRHAAGRFNVTTGEIGGGGSVREIGGFAAIGGDRAGAHPEGRRPERCAQSLVQIRQDPEDTEVISGGRQKGLELSARFVGATEAFFEQRCAPQADSPHVIDARGERRSAREQGCGSLVITALFCIPLHCREGVDVVGLKCTELRPTSGGSVLLAHLFQKWCQLAKDLNLLRASYEIGEGGERCRASPRLMRVTGETGQILEDARIVREGAQRVGENVQRLVGLGARRQERGEIPCGATVFGTREAAPLELGGQELFQTIVSPDARVQLSEPDPRLLVLFLPCGAVGIDPFEGLDRESVVPAAFRTRGEIEQAADALHRRNGVGDAIEKPGLSGELSCERGPTRQLGIVGIVLGGGHQELRGMRADRRVRGPDRSRAREGDDRDFCIFPRAYGRSRRPTFALLRAPWKGRTGRARAPRSTQRRRRNAERARPPRWRAWGIRDRAPPEPA